ncbi:MAG: flagellar basal body P-ring protein FlgI [Longimicrobiales bacterium]
MPYRRLVIAALALLFGFGARSAHAQTARVRDLTITDGEAPVRLVGYGLVVGLEGTGDRVFGGILGGMTVRTVANLLRNLGIEVPEQMIRTRNAAAVLVTAEASPYTRRGGRFDVSVASLGDATSLRGGQLWQTPLLASVGGAPMAFAQGNIAISASGRLRADGPTETSAVLTSAAVALSDMTEGPIPTPNRLLLREPDLATAQRIAESVNTAVGPGAATVQDPGAIALTLPQDDPLASLVAIGELEITPSLVPRVVIDGQSGAVAAGGDISVGPAVVSHDWLTLTISPPTDPLTAAADSASGAVLAPGAVRAEAGVRVQALAEALHSVGATAEVIGAVFRSLRTVGAIHAEVLIR